MNFYNGFALENCETFFEEYLEKGEYVIAGFSYGAIKALEFVLNNTTQRIDKLQLFSPAFFQTKKESFKRLQLSGYKSNANTYLKSFLENCFLPYQEKKIVFGKHSETALHELLYYEWEVASLQLLLNRGINIEVFLGLDDRIIDVENARLFFLPYATVTTIKKANHFLQEN